MVGWAVWAGESPRPLIYGFFFNYFYRLATLAALLRNGGGIARLLSRPPHPERPSYQVTVGEGRDAVPGNLGAYVLVLGVLGLFSVLLLNVKDQEWGTPAQVFGEELLAGLAFGAVWWLLDLVDRRVTLRFDQDLVRNLGYNSSETTVLALTVLTGGIVSGVMDTPWPYFLALLAWKFLYDVWDEVKFPRGEHMPSAADPRMRDLRRDAAPRRRAPR
jgi:hypothetical protein